ncbi:hypothetical protein TI04_00805 [Achromatium sp. WMS2]|nr:hypothetical protein TI04_00805 [Achromatium sp. WMS2]
MYIHWITEHIAQGPKPYGNEYQDLVNNGITHILDLTEFSATVQDEITTQLHIIHEYIIDFQFIPYTQVEKCCQIIYDILEQPQHKLYIHCWAGIGRSSTILWLYLIGCGIDPELAKNIIKTANRAATPGNKSLSDSSHISCIKAYAADHGWSKSTPRL